LCAMLGCGFVFALSQIVELKTETICSFDPCEASAEGLDISTLKPLMTLQCNDKQSNIVYKTFKLTAMLGSSGTARHTPPMVPLCLVSGCVALPNLMRMLFNMASP
jgi:hypothetical protein